MKKFFCVILGLLMAVTPSAFVFADATWTPAANDWVTGANWLPATAPGMISGTVLDTDTAIFSNTPGHNFTTVSVDNNRNLQNITFNAAAEAYTLMFTSSIFTFLLTAGGTIQNNSSTANSQNINLNTQLNGAYTFNSNSNVSGDIYTMNFGKSFISDSITQAVTGALTLGGANTGNNTISTDLKDGAGTLSLIKTGAGTWVLSGTNTFTGGVVVNQGTIKIGFGDSLGAHSTAVTAVTVNSGGAIDFNGINNAEYGYTIAGTGVAGTGALVNTGAAIGLSVAQASNIKLSADAAIGGTGDWALLTAGWGATVLDLNGFTLTKTGSDVFTLTSTTITPGTISIADGTVALHSYAGTPVDASAANFVLSGAAGAVLDLSSKNLTIASLQGGGTTGGNVNLGSGDLTVNQTTDTTYAGAISGSGGILTKHGVGKLTLSGTNTYTGGTTIAAGGGTLIALDNAAALGTGTVTLAGGKLQLIGNTGRNFGNAIAITGNAEIDSDTLAAVTGVTHTLGALTLGANTLTIGLGVTAASGTQGLIFGPVTLTGNAAINAGAGAGGAGSLLTLGNLSGTTGGAPETLTLNAGSAALTFNGTIHGFGGGQDSSGLTDLTVTNSGAVNFNGDIAITGALTQTNAATGATTFANTVAVGSAALRGTTFDVQNSLASTGAIAVTNSGTFTKEATGAITAPGGFSTSGDVSTGNNISTTNNALTIGGNLTATANSALAAGSGLISVTGTTTINDGVTLTLGTGGLGGVTMAGIAGIGGGTASNITFNTTGVVSAGAVGTDIGALTLTNSGGATFSGTVDAATITINDSAAASTVAFQGNVNATTGMSSAATAHNYNVSILGTTNNIAGDTNFLNTGLTTIGNDATDSSTFAGGLGAVSGGGVSIAGTVATTNTQMDLGAVTLTKAATLSSGIGAINVASLDNGGNLLTVTNTGASNATISGIVSGGGGLTKTGTGTLTLSGIASNTYTGLTAVSAGELDLNKTAGINAIGGNLLISGAGTVKLFAAEQIVNTAAINMTGGAFSLNGMNETVDTFSNSGGTFTTGAGHLTGLGATVTWSGGTNTVNNGGLVADSHIVITGGTNIVEGGAAGGVLELNSGGTGLEMTGATLTLNSDAANAGKLLLQGNVTTYASAASSNISNGLSLANSGTIDLDGGTRTFTVAAGAAASDLAISAVITNGAVTKAGTGVLTLSGANTYTGDTTINAGTFQAGAVNAFSAGSATTVGAAGTLDLNSFDNTINLLAGAAGSKITLGTGTLSTGSAADTIYAGVISGAGNFIKQGTGMITLSGANTYSGITTINAGTLRAGSGSALGTGAGGVVNNATLDIGANTLNIGGAYNQAGHSTLKLTIDSLSAWGKIVSSADAVVSALSTINVTIAAGLTIPNNSTFTVIDGAGGLNVNVPGTIISGSSLFELLGSVLNGDLILTAHYASNSAPLYASLATDSNGRAAGSALDNISNPSGDMTTVLSALTGLSNAQAAKALDTMVPAVDAGVRDNSTAALNNFVAVSLDRAQSVLALDATGNYTDKCILPGHDDKINGIWAKEYGTHLDQGERKGIQGYDAWNAGTAIGVDRLFGDTFTLGISGGYAYGNVDSDANNARTTIESAQGAVYAGYQGRDIPYFIEAAGSFARNWYKAKRDIDVGAINRIADSTYDGLQYGSYLGGGYNFELEKNIEVTPLASIQWDHLGLFGYTENNAGAMDLSVNRQSYDMLQSGLGVSAAFCAQYKWGNFTPEFHAKWLYDFIGDSVAVTSAYAGGGSFTANGAKSAKDSANLGGKLFFDFKNDISLIARCDTQVKSKFFGVYGSVTVRYRF